MKYFFFFQAEDGIRDYKVTGVQTCALPISRPAAETSSLSPNRTGPGILPRPARSAPTAPRTAVLMRSEEHTSELQSPCNLVCRLLLEKKKIHPNRTRHPHAHHVRRQVMSSR